MSVDKSSVLNALLALDAYNRNRFDEQRKMSDLNGVELSDEIGDVVFVNSSDRMEAGNTALAGAGTAGFSASYYTIAGETLISYRGTDFNFSTLEGALEFLKDFGTARASTAGSAA